MHTVKFLKKELVAHETVAFYFEKPADFVFKAGQFVDIFLLDPKETALGGNSKTYSIASSPHEPHLMIATRLRNSAFKRTLKNLHEGAPVSVSDPMGSFTLHRDASKPAVFLIGGIGVAPARSIVLNATANKNPRDVFLLYSNRRPEDAAFLNELTKVSKQNMNFKIIPTMTGMAHPRATPGRENSPQPWIGETGYIDFEMIKKYVQEPAEAIYYSAGPLPMVNAMRTTLNAAGIHDDNIRTEEFAGY